MDKNGSGNPIRIHRSKVLWLLAKAAMDKDRPVLAQIVVTRRCNLSCGYCYEYDKVSKPIPLEILKERIDALKRLKTVFVTLNGGEPLLHPQIADLVRYIAELGMVPMINSNGHVLKLPLIQQLNDAGLFGMQLSCDALEDNAHRHAVQAGLDRRQGPPRPLGVAIALLPNSWGAVLGSSRRSGRSRSQPKCCA